jgi:hypothetical protein
VSRQVIWEVQAIDQAAGFLRDHRPADLAAPTSTGANPAAAEVSQLRLANAQLTSQLQVPPSELRSAPLLAPSRSRRTTTMSASSSVTMRCADRRSLRGIRRP